MLCQASLEDVEEDTIVSAFREKRLAAQRAIDHMEVLRGDFRTRTSWHNGLLLFSKASATPTGFRPLSLK